MVRETQAAHSQKQEYAGYLRKMMCIRAFEEKVFEAGFTTRAGPFHAGMGLPVSRYLAGQAGGTLLLANVSGGGCAATIRMPSKPRS